MKYDKDLILKTMKDLVKAYRQDSKDPLFDLDECIGGAMDMLEIRQAFRDANND